MNLECDEIGEDGLNAVTSFLQCKGPIVSLTLDDVGHHFHVLLTDTNLLFVITQNKFQGRSQNNVEAFVAGINNSHLQHLSLNMNPALRDQLFAAFICNPPPPALRVIRLSGIDYDIYEYSTSMSALLLPRARLLLLRRPRLLSSLPSGLPLIYSSSFGVADDYTFPDLEELGYTSQEPTPSLWGSLPVELQLGILRKLAPILSLPQYLSVTKYAADPNTLSRKIGREAWLSEVGCECEF
jgi:hypothetical protein